MADQVDESSFNQHDQSFARRHGQGRMHADGKPEQAQENRVREQMHSHEPENEQTRRPPAPQQQPDADRLQQNGQRDGDNRSDLKNGTFTDRIGF